MHNCLNMQLMTATKERYIIRPAGMHRLFCPDTLSVKGKLIMHFFYRMCT